MKTIDKIKNKLKQFNKQNNNLLYWISVGILAAIGVFVFITMILQTNWFGIKEANYPILVYIVASPRIGIFFLPFILLLSYVCWFIVSVGKPVTIQQTQNDSRSLYENGDIVKDEYELIHDCLDTAKERKRKANQDKLKEISRKNIEIKEGDLLNEEE